MTGRHSALALGLLLVAYPAFSQDHARSREEPASNSSASSAAERHPDPTPVAPAPVAPAPASSWNASAFEAQDHAQSRGGGSGGSSSSGSSHPSTHSSSGSSSGSSGSSGGRSDSGSSGVTDAQRRHPRPGTGSGYFNDRRSVIYGSPYYYNSFGYYPYDLYYGFNGYSPYYYSGFYGYSQGYYNRNRYGYVGALRLLVEPSETAVYVDGYYAGIADDFDGLLQRLRISPGRHDITLRLDGFQTQRLKIYVPIEETLKIHHKMVKGTGEGPEATIGEPDRYAERDRYADRDRYPDRDRENEDQDREADGRMGGERRADGGQLRLEIRPADASIYVDGEFRGTARRVLSLSLPPGRHRVEVVRPGYRTFEREVELRPGRTEDVTVDLER
jgi:PEGA domain-containing protein